MKLFYNCSLFDEKEFILTNNFVVKQQELLVKNLLSNNNYSFDKINVEYKCNWNIQNDWDNKKPTIIIPIKDNIELLSKTIKNLIENNISDICNIIIVDDRSTMNIKSIVLKNNLSYLRIDNQKGFNFSMLNNIAAFIVHKLKGEEIILWNSDLWCVKQEYFIELLKRHRENNSLISGSKLIYPPIEQSMSKEIDSDNIKLHFPNMSNGLWRNTVQFGGSGWTPTSLIALSPIHAFRFKQIDDNRVNCDKGETFVTGALQVINLKWFIESGGLNPSLSKNFQDVDLCLRAIQQKNKIFYFGKDIYFYHDESLSLNKEGKYDLQLESDHILFSKIWNKTIFELVL